MSRESNEKRALESYENPSSWGYGQRTKPLFGTGEDEGDDGRNDTPLASDAEDESDRHEREQMEGDLSSPDRFEME